MRPSIECSAIFALLARGGNLASEMRARVGRLKIVAGTHGPGILVGKRAFFSERGLAWPRWHIVRSDPPLRPMRPPQRSGVTAWQRATL